MVYMFEDLIKCSRSGQMFMIFIYTAGILYLFYNFEQIVKTMETEMVRIRKNKQQRIGFGDLTVNSSHNRNHSGGYRRGTTQNAETADNDDFRHPWYSKCRRPYFWISMIVLAAIITDALFETIME